MSNFIQDIAGWALGGGASQANNGTPNTSVDAPEIAQVQSPPPMTAEEIRAQRLARMEQQQQRHQQQAAPKPMEIDGSDEQGDTEMVDVTEGDKQRPPISDANTHPQKTNQTTPSKTAAPKQDSVSTPADTERRLQKKKEFLIKKTLDVSLQKSSSCMDDDDFVDTGSTDVSINSIGLIIATRLSSPPPSQKLMVISYLGESYYRCLEELKTLNAKKKPSPDLVEILQEIQKQTVSYAATCLAAPELFPEVSKDGFVQVAACLLQSVSPDSSKPFNIAQGSNSFYSKLVRELEEQNPETLHAMVAVVVDHFMEKLKLCNSVLDSSGNESALTVVTALNVLCTNKVVASIVMRMESFLLPVAGSPQASEIVRPALVTQSIELFMANAVRPYEKRSGPGIEKHTILGQCLRVGLPKHNTAAFPVDQVLRQPLAVIESVMSSHRRQLAVYQQACHNLVMNLLKAGMTERQTIMTWVTDALLVNSGASATRPDTSKVSSESFRLNLSMLLLKLCQPFVDDEKKQHLIHPGFVGSNHDHGGVFATTGDNAVPRLGDPKEAIYNPKNPFIPFCFFFCARSLHFSLSAILSQHETLLRHVSYLHHELTARSRDIHSDPRFATLISRQRSEEVVLFQEELSDASLTFCNFMAKVLVELPDESLASMPEDFVSDCCQIMLGMAQMKPSRLHGISFRNVFQLVVKLLSGRYASMVRNYNLRAQLGDVLYELFLPHSRRGEDVPASVWTDQIAGGRTYLISDTAAQETLAPSLLLLYGEVEHTGYFDKMSHRAKIASLIKYLWESTEHRPAFKRITQDHENFMKFANGIMNETNTLIATVMQKLPEIREAQLLMSNSQEWSRISEDEQSQITSRLEDNERDVKSSLPLCNKTLQMFGYLNTDEDIRSLFLLDQLCNRLVSMLLHVLTKLVGSRGLELKVENPEQYDFRPKEMLRDLCAIFALFASYPRFQEECARSGGDPQLLESAAKTCQRLNLLTGESLQAFQKLPESVYSIKQTVAEEESLIADAPEEFSCELLCTFMKDPVRLPSNHVVDRSNITQHLLNDATDPFNRAPLTVEQLVPDIELKKRMDAWLQVKRASRVKSEPESLP